MKHLIKLILFTLLINSHAQTYDDYLHGDKKNFFQIYQDANILITNDGTDTFFSGFLAFQSSSNGSVTIKPEIGYVVKILPIGIQNKSTIGTGTLIGVKVGGNGGLNKLATSVEIYPNPAISSIQLKSTENIIGYKIYNSQGTLKSENSLLKSKQFSVNINNLNPDIYHTVILLDNGQSISKQFIKQ